MCCLKLFRTTTLAFQNNNKQASRSFLINFVSVCEWSSVRRGDNCVTCWHELLRQLKGGKNLWSWRKGGGNMRTRSIWREMPPWTSLLYTWKSGRTLKFTGGNTETSEKAYSAGRAIDSVLAASAFFFKKAPFSRRGFESSSWLVVDFV